jgi:hypothetical protein
MIPDQYDTIVTVLFVVGLYIVAAWLWRERKILRDKVDGLEADLDNAVEVAWKRGAHEWTRLNYPKHYARFTTPPSAR